MLLRNALVVALLVSCVAVVSVSADDYGDLVNTTLLAQYDRCTLALPDKVMIYWTINSGAGTIDVAITVKGTGWVGFGPGTSMVGSDPAIGWVSDTGLLNIGDYTISAQAGCNAGTGVCLDTSKGGTNDVSNAEGWEDASLGVTTIMYTRPLAAQNTNFDKPFTSGQNSYVVATNVGSDTVDFGHTHRNPFIRNFFASQTCPNGTNGLPCSGPTNGACDKGCCVCNGGFAGRACATTVVPDPTGTTTGGNFPPLTPTIDPASYDFSKQLDGNFQLFWNLLGTDAIEIAVKVKATGWVAFGPSPRAQMVGSDVMLGWISQTGNPILGDYYITDQSGGPVTDEQVNGFDNILEFTGEFDGTFTSMKWRRKLDTGDAAGDSPYTTDGPMDVVFAYHPTNKFISQHTASSRGVASINLMTGAVKVTDDQMIRVAHGIMMFIAWGAFLPFGGFVGRFLKRFTWWWPLHYIMNSLAIILTVTAFILAIVMTKVHFSDPHKIIGLIVVILGVAQPFIGYAANKFFNPERTSVPVWPDKVHWVVGWTALALGLVNVLLGLLLFDASKGLIAAYCIFAVVVILIIVGFFIFRLIKPAKGH